MVPIAGMIYDIDDDTIGFSSILHLFESINYLPSRNITPTYM